MKTVIAVLSSTGVPEFLWFCLLAIVQSMYLARLKSDIEHENAMKLADHTANLTSQNNLDISAFKNKLTMAASERDIKLTRVFEKQADKIEMTFADLLKVKEAFDLFTNDLSRDSRPVNSAVLNEAKVQFEANYHSNLIYFPKGTAENIMKLYNAIGSADLAYKLALNESGPTGDAELRGKLFTNFVTVRDSLPGLISLLIDDFQGILGFAKPNEKIKTSVGCVETKNPMG